MKEFNQVIDEKYFNMLWRALSERESELVASIEVADSDEAALLSNDLVYLRLCIEDLKQKAYEAKFSKGSFNLDDGYIDLADM